MRKYSAFDILGPVMIGPSSSHTAGAARLGKIAKMIAGEDISKVTFLLHGSFAKTYKGHGTDKALVAGILGMDPWDERLKDSFKIADSNGINIKFEEADLGDVHPNTVKFIIEKKDGNIVEVRGCSIGGGNIMINEVDGEEIEFTGDYPTLIIKHRDMPGVISKVTERLYLENINIAFMRVYRNKKGSNAIMVFETDSVVPKEVVNRITGSSYKIKEFGYIKSVRIISPLTEGE